MRLAGVLVLALVAAGTARAAQPVALPSPGQGVRGQPPLTAGVLLAERRFPRHVASTQSVLVGVDSHGRAVRLVDVDRLVVTGKGDYVFGIPGPITDVRPGPGTESQPGLRTGTIVWQGFSPGRRVLAARITLRPRLAVAGLPVRLAVTRSAGALVLEIRNVTRSQTSVTLGRARALEVAAALDRMLAAVRRHAPAVTEYVNTNGRIQTSGMSVGIPVAVAGQAVTAAGERSVRTTIPPGRAARVPLGAKGSRRLKKLSLVVSIPEPAALLAPPGARSWRAAARAGRLPRGRAAMPYAAQRILEAALAQQYHAFLANPEPAGVSRTSYRFETVTAPPRAPRKHAVGSPQWPWIVLGAAIGLLVGAGGLVAWAHA